MNVTEQIKYKLWMGSKEVLLVFLGTLCFAIGSSWISESIDLKELSFDVSMFSIGLSVSVIGAYLAIHFGRKLLPITTLRQRDEPRPHKVLLMFVSTANPLPKKTDNGWMLEKEGKIVKLEPSLDEVIQQKINGVPFPWQQLLRAIKTHQKEGSPRVEAVYLIGSGDICEGKGSHGQLNTAVEFIRFYFPELKKIEGRPRDRGIDFENMNEIISLLNNLVNEAKEDGYQEKDIMIDITGGQKTASIAGALVTLHHSELEFQYVGTNAPYVTKSFNAILAERGEPA